jgi:hypothetical protein
MQTAHRTKPKPKAKHPAPPRERVKGETVVPTNTLLLISRIGVTRAHRELGVSTTTLHKARQSGVVSKVVEIAATAALSHLGDTARAPVRVTEPQPFTQTTPPDRITAAGRAVFLISVEQSKAHMVMEFARMLDAEVVAH